MYVDVAPSSDEGLAPKIELLNVLVLYAKELDALDDTDIGSTVVVAFHTPLCVYERIDPEAEAMAVVLELVIEALKSEVEALDSGGCTNSISTSI